MTQHTSRRIQKLITFSPVLYEIAKEKSSRLGLSLADYLRHLVVSDGSISILKSDYWKNTSNHESNESDDLLMMEKITKDAWDLEEVDDFDYSSLEITPYNGKL